jgi:hypothetical protein
MPVRIGSPGPSTLSALALGIPCSETTDSAQSWVLPFISSSLGFGNVKNIEQIAVALLCHIASKSRHIPSF